jgi:crotonobetainyl-CoA:carnitine CoA-transferase CaiB-like acyl-CoA transferase
MAMSYLVAGELPQRVGLGSQLTCPYGDFDCADGKMMIAVGNDKQFVQLCKVLGRPDLTQDERYATTSQRVAHKHVLLPIIAGILKQRTMADWMPLFSEANVPSGPINDFRQVFDDPQIRHRELVHSIPHPLSGSMSVVGNPLKFSETPIEYGRPPPLLGQHTAEVLRELLDMDDDEIKRLTEQSVVTL